MPRTSTKGREILEFIEKQMREKGYPPSIREICAAVGLKSTSSVHAQLKNLERAGLLVKENSKMRAIKLTNKNVITEPEQPKTSTTEYLEVPIVGRVAAGNPILAVEETTDFLPLPMNFAKNKDLFILTVTGDSMVNAAILDGDYVIVQQQPTADNGDIVVALVDDSATVKRFYKEDGYFRLQPENDAMAPIIVDEVLILGKVVGVFRRM